MLDHVINELGFVYVVSAACGRSFVPLIILHQRIFRRGYVLHGIELYVAIDHDFRDWLDDVQLRRNGVEVLAVLLLEISYVDSGKVANHELTCVHVTYVLKLLLCHL